MMKNIFTYYFYFPFRIRHEKQKNLLIDAAKEPVVVNIPRQVTLVMYTRH